MAFQQWCEFGAVDVAGNQQGGVVRTNPLLLVGVEVLWGHRLQTGDRAGAAGRLGVGVGFAVEQAGQGAGDEARGLGLLLCDGRFAALAQAVELLGGEGRIAQYIREQGQTVVEEGTHGAEADRRVVARNPRGKAGAEGFGVLADGDGVPAWGAARTQRFGHAGQARAIGRIGGIAGIGDEAEFHLRHAAARGEHHLQTVGQGEALTLGQGECWWWADRLGHGAAVIGDCTRTAWAARVDLEHVAVVLQPARSAVAHLFRRGGAVLLELFAPGVRAAAQREGACQQIGLAAAADVLQAANGGSVEAHPAALHGIGVGAFASEVLQDFVNGGFQLGQRHAFGRGGVDDELRAQQFGPDAGRHLRGNLALLDQYLVQRAGAAAAQQIASQFQQIGVFAESGRDVPGHEQPGLRHLVHQHLALFLGEWCDVARRAMQRRAGGNGAKVVLDPLDDVLGLDVASDHEHGVVRPVVRLEPVANIIEGGGFDVFDLADGRPGIGVPFGIAALHQMVPHGAVGAVPALLELVLDDALLALQLVLGDGIDEITHAFRLQPQGAVERPCRHGLVVVGAVGAGGAVHAGGADLGQWLEVFAIVVLAAGEHQMFEQVGEAGAVLRLILGTDAIPDVNPRYRGLGVFVDQQRESIVEGML